MESDWVSAVLPRLEVADIKRLSDGHIRGTNQEQQVNKGLNRPSVMASKKEVLQRRNDSTSISNARKRFMERRAAKTK